MGIGEDALEIQNNAGVKLKACMCKIQFSGAKARGIGLDQD